MTEKTVVTSSQVGNSSSADQERMVELRTAWGMLPHAPLVAIGRLRSPGEKPYSYLEALEHPTNGSGLAYPTQTGPAAAWVPPVEVKRFSSQMYRWREPKWAIAELVLSPEHERITHANPHACVVRPGTLRLLEELPPDWNSTVMGGEAARLLTQSARAALEDHVRAEVSRVSEELTTRIRDNKATLQRIDEAMANARQRQAEQSARIPQRSRELTRGCSRKLTH